MSLDKSRIPKLGDSSRKFIPEKQRRAMTDSFVERITRTRTDKGETVSGRMVETRSQKHSEERKAMLEVEVHPDQAMNENREIHGPEGRGNRRLAGTGDEGESQEEEEDDEKQSDFGSQVSLNSSTQENEAYTNRGTGTMDKLGVVRTISKTTNTSGQSRDFVSMTNS